MVPGGASLLDALRKRLKFSPLVGQRRFVMLFNGACTAPQRHKLGKPQKGVDPHISLRLPHGWWLAEGASWKSLEQIGPCVWSPFMGHCAAVWGASNGGGAAGARAGPPKLSSRNSHFRVVLCLRHAVSTISQLPLAHILGLNSRKRLHAQAGVRCEHLNKEIGPG